VSFDRVTNAVASGKAPGIKALAARFLQNRYKQNTKDAMATIELTRFQRKEPLVMPDGRPGIGPAELAKMSQASSPHLLLLPSTFGMHQCASSCLPRHPGHTIQGFHNGANKSKQSSLMTAIHVCRNQLFDDCHIEVDPINSFSGFLYKLAHRGLNFITNLEIGNLKLEIGPVLCL
jgi:hypothetical protein